MAGELPSAAWVHRYTDAAGVAFADRAMHVADPDFVSPPAGHWTSQLKPAYLQSRAAKIGDKSLQQAQPGMPGGQRSAVAAQAEQPERGTSHISIVDGEGRALAVTTTIEAVFGAHRMLDGGTRLASGFFRL